MPPALPAPDRAEAMDSSMVIAAAPNGARKTKIDHPHLPLTTKELIETAISCANAGASMMHFHIRDGKGRHSLDPEHYRRSLSELEAAVGDRLLLQVTSEAAGIYRQPEQIELLQRLAPHCLSCALREFIRSEDDLESGSLFFSKLYDAGALIQYILYSPAEVAWFVKLCQQGVLPGSKHFMLFVFGRYLHRDDTDIASLDEYLLPLKQHPWPYSWMVCGFDQHEFEVAEGAAARGGHIRVGFENNCCRPDGSQARNNSEQVNYMRRLAETYGRTSVDSSYAAALHR